jgi:hypothetical protein
MAIKIALTAMAPIAAFFAAWGVVTVQHDVLGIPVDGVGPGFIGLFLGAAAGIAVLVAWALIWRNSF